MFLGLFCLAAYNEKKDFCCVISQLLHTKKYCTALKNLLVQMPPVTSDQCYATLTQL